MSQPAPISSESKSTSSPRLLRSSAVTSAMTMTSRVMGLVRDVVFAWYIGAAGGADAFYVAFKIPNFLRRLFAEGAFAQAFVPVLSEYRHKGNAEVVRGLIDRVAGCLGMSVILVSLIAVLGAPALTFVFAPGFYFSAPEKYALTVELIRITFPYLALITMAGFVGAILNSYDRFAVPALTPVLLNVVLIVAAIGVSPHLETPVLALAWGVLVAGILQFGFQLPFLARINLMPRPKVEWSDPAVKRILTLMVPALFAVSVSQINLLLDTALASLISDGSVSWLYYSDRLIELPLGVFGIAIATVILPTLSRQFTADSEHYSSTLDWAIKAILMISFPSTVALMVLAKPIIITLFQHGKNFTAFDAQMAAYSLMAFALGLTAFMLIKVLVTGYFSRQDTRTPVKIGIQAMISNMGFNVILVIPLHCIWQVGHVGLALATSSSAFLNAGLLLTGLVRGGFYKPHAGWLRFLVTFISASFAMGAALWIALRWLPDFASLHWGWRIVHLSWLCGFGLLVYFATLLACGWHPRDFKPRFG